MPAESSLRQTAVHGEHVSAGARMVAFAGWDLPVQYGSIIDEHLAVRTRAGLFDVSHMGEAAVRGAQSLDFLQKVTCNNVARLKPGRIQYTGLMTPTGAFLDDLLVYKLDEDDYLLVLNAANTPKDVAWLLRHAEDFDVEVIDTSAKWTQLALQGPASVEILEPLAATPLAEMRYYAFEQTEVDGVRCIVSRTGYTGEDGFEIYGPWADGARLWRSMLRAGESRGLKPVGLAARDTLRLEAKMALYGNDIDETTTALEADLGWIVKLEKGDFIGREILAGQAADGVQRKLVGFEMRGRAIARHGYPALSAGNEVGRVTSGSFAPFLKKNIGLAYLPIELTELGSEFQVGIRGREEPAVVVPTPFYKRPR